ncbi:MAG: von Willebrand factor type A domain-containing protein [Verrucomicrobiota bacterium]
MKLQADDPRLTNYLLGECSNAERLEIEHLLRENPELQKELEELQALTQSLSTDLRQTPQEGLKPDQIMAIERHIQARRKIVRWNFKEDGFHWGIGVAVAASLAIGWVMLDRLTSLPSQPSTPSVASNTTVEIPLIFSPAGEASSLPDHTAAPIPKTPSSQELTDANILATDPTLTLSEENISLPTSSLPITVLAENKFLPSGFLNPKNHEWAAVALETSSRSYAAIQKSIEAGVLPSPEIVQMDGLINAFKANDAAPSTNDPYKVHIQIASCPWNTKNALARISLIAKKGSTKNPSPVAQHVQWHFQLNPERVQSYRILGYDDALNKSIATLPATHVMPLNFQRIVLIEIIPVSESKTQTTTAEWLSVHIQHQNNQGELIQKSIALQGTIQNLDQATSDFQFAAATAQFGALLKKLPHTEQATWNSTLTLARKGLDVDPEGERHQFVRLIEKAQNLAAAK